MTHPPFIRATRANHPGRRASPQRGFSLIELVIVVVIIGIIAAIAIPRMSRGSAGAADRRCARTSGSCAPRVDTYQAEHGGTFPTPTGSITVPDLLLKYSNADGTAVSASKDAANNITYGPYMRTIPAITVGTEKGSNGIAISTTTGVAATAGTGIAWLYNAADGTIAPNASGNDSTGKSYSSY